MIAARALPRVAAARTVARHGRRPVATLPRVNRGARGVLVDRAGSRAGRHRARIDERDGDRHGRGRARGHRPVRLADVGVLGRAPVRDELPVRDHTRARSKRLRLRWFFNTRDVVTATPTLVDGTVYVGDWSGRFYALRAATASRAGPSRPSPNGSSTAARSSRRRRSPTSTARATVFVPSGKTMYALRASDGHELLAARARPARRQERPDRDRVVAGRRGRQGHLRLGRAQLREGVRGRGHRARTRGPAARSGSSSPRRRRTRVPRIRDRPARAAVTSGARRRSTASAGLVIFGTGNCTDAVALGPLQRRDGRGRPRDGRGALDVPAAPVEPRRPRLRRRAEPDRRSTAATLAGLGNKDGAYYLVDRATGAHVATVDATDPGLNRPGQQLLDRWVHRTVGVQRRHRRRRHRGRPGPVPARHRRRDRDDRLAEPGAERDLRRDRDRRRRRDRRRHRLHPARRRRSTPATSCGRTR